MHHATTPAHEALISFLYQVPIGLVQSTAAGEILMINPMAASMLMPLAPSGPLANLFDVLAPVAPDLRTVADARTSPGPVWDRHTSIPANSRTFAIRLTRLSDATLMTSLLDVTDAVAREDAFLAMQLAKAAHTDSLTSLPNRMAFADRLQAVLDDTTARDARCAVLFINCDRFKHINDAHGRNAGDALLRCMGDRLTGVLRARASVLGADAGTAARLGTDEFAVLLQGLPPEDDIRSIAEALLGTLGQPYAIEGQALHATVSIGVVEWWGSPQAQAQRDDADGVMQDAGIAVNEAKRRGGARVCVFETAMREHATQRGRTEADLRLALANRELFVVYQPLVDLRDGSSAGFEALVRWHHPTRGLVMPTDFIGIAEETGLICPLGDYVLDVACRQFMAWRGALGAAAPRSMSVNLSRAQLAQPQLTERVAQVLADNAMPPGCLQLEVTESLAAQDGQVQDRLHELKSLGVTLALDDFGTGYSSLSSLHLLPLDVVKIDRSFITLAESSPHHCVLIQATVQVASSLGMSTVAEGIETEGQAAMLRRLGCHKGQGYLFSRPLGVEQATRWLEMRANDAPAAGDAPEGAAAHAAAAGADSGSATAPRTPLAAAIT